MTLPESTTPPVADALYHQLDPRFVPLQRKVKLISATVTSLILIVMLMMFLTLVNEPPWFSTTAWILWTVVTLARFAFALQWPAIQYRFASYKVDDQGIEIRGGVIIRTVSNVPRSRVQHTDVSQGPFERSHGLATLVIHTAGTLHAVAVVRGLEHARALLIREHLLPREGDDAV